MLDQYFENLQHSIQWAKYEDDLDVLCLAKHNMDMLMELITTLPSDDQQKAHRKIDEVLPMEWPLWMEACRYEDGQHNKNSGIVLH